MPFTVTEPHPTVQANAYTHAGRGGLGNTFRVPAAVTPAAGVPTSVHGVGLDLTKSRSASSVSSCASATRFYSGRGGAGNAHPVTERRSLSLNEEYAYASLVAAAALSGHVGRGGAGNVARKAALAPSPKTHRSDSASTADSRDLEKHHAAIAAVTSQRRSKAKALFARFMPSHAQ